MKLIFAIAWLSFLGAFPQDGCPIDSDLVYSSLRSAFACYKACKPGFVSNDLTMVCWQTCANVCHGASLSLGAICYCKNFNGILGKSRYIRIRSGKEFYCKHTAAIGNQCLET